MCVTNVSNIFQFRKICMYLTIVVYKSILQQMLQDESDMRGVSRSRFICELKFSLGIQSN